MTKNEEEFKIIWRDKLDSIIWGVYIFCFIAAFFIGAIIPDRSNIQIAIITVILGPIFSIGIYSLLRKTILIILDGGIILDNTRFIPINLLKGTNIKISSRRNFINWKEINTLTLKNREVRGGRMSSLMTFLVLNTNKGKYQTKVTDVKGFIEALKKLNKYHLLSKDSKYR